MLSSGACWRANSKRCGACSMSQKRSPWSNSVQDAVCLRRMYLPGRRRCSRRFIAPLRYNLMEGSAGLRSRLAELFAEDIGSGKVRIAATLDEVEFKTPFIVFANEFFDALPVEVLDYRGELRVMIDGSRFAETFVPPSAAVLDYVDRFAVHPERGERVDVPLIVQDYMRRIAALAATQLSSPVTSSSSTTATRGMSNWLDGIAAQSAHFGNTPSATRSTMRPESRTLLQTLTSRPLLPPRARTASILSRWSHSRSSWSGSAKIRSSPTPLASANYRRSTRNARCNSNT